MFVRTSSYLCVTQPVDRFNITNITNVVVVVAVAAAATVVADEVGAVTLVVLRPYMSQSMRC